MILNEVLKRFAQTSAITVMARVGLARALDTKWVEELFEQERRSQYTRELLFSTTVEVMSLVAVGLRPSVHAAAKEMPELGVSVQALYDKIKGTEPHVIRALVSGSAERLAPVIEELIKQQTPTVKGYRLRIVDGNHLPASEKRLKPLRGFRGAALPGQSLVVYDPDLQLAVDVLPSEDAHTQERLLMQTILGTAAPGDLWIADRNFCTGPILCGLLQRGAHFLIREHGANPNPDELSAPRRIGRIETGSVYEQEVCIKDEQGVSHTLRRIELRLKEPTEDGDRVIRLLSNVPKSKMKAKNLTRLYRRRWRIGVSRQRTRFLVGESPTEVKRLRPRSLGGVVARKQDGEALRQHTLKGACAKHQVVTTSERRCSLVTRCLRWPRRSITREGSKNRVARVRRDGSHRRGISDDMVRQKTWKLEKPSMSGEESSSRRRLP